jgi:uroporphyrinogen decarboxylase
MESEGMNPRQRVITALNHQEPDMVPIDLGSTENTTICRIAYINLREFLNLGPDPSPYVINRQMDSVFPQEDLLHEYQVDFRPVKPSSSWKARTREMPDDSFYDEYSIRWRKASYYYDMVEHPLARSTLADLPKATFADPYARGRVEGIRAQAQWLYENTDFALVVGHIAWGPFEMCCSLRGYEQFLVDLYDDTRYAEALLDKTLESAIGFWDVYLREVGEFVQVVCQGDDLGTQTGPWISPEMYRRFIKPRHKQLFDFIHSKTKARTFLHSCGSVYDLIPDFIDAGVEILSPVQRSAAKMDLGRLKREFGKDICFWGGGIDTQHVLPNATLDEIRDHVGQTFDVMAPGGGWVFVPVHNIQADIAPERVQAVYETALKKRKYRA